MTTGYKKIQWTDHSKIKMRQYGLSISKLLSILRRPDRKEKGIVPGTLAVMRTNKVFKKSAPLLKEKQQVIYSKSKTWQKKAPGEIWIMFKDVNPRGGSGQERRIISAWRYPGISKPGEEIPPGHGIELLKKLID